MTRQRWRTMRFKGSRMATSTEGPVSVRLRIGKVVPAIDAVFTLTVN
jgi:hypothetical protein